MPDLLDERVKQHVNVAQITNTIRLSRFFVLSILIVSLYVYVIYQFNFSKPSPYFNLWFIATEILGGLSLIITSIYFKPRNFVLKYAHRWIQLQCLILGSCIGVGISLLYYDLPQYNTAFNPTHGLILSALLMIVTQSVALLCLTQRLNYFC